MIRISCGGTVVKAGWGSGYGYVVYINHEDGRQTRYAHLSKILVKAGEYVKQGQKIALSGNGGTLVPRSTILATASMTTSSFRISRWVNVSFS